MKKHQKPATAAAPVAAKSVRKPWWIAVILIAAIAVGAGIYGLVKGQPPEDEARVVAKNFMTALINGDEAKARSLLYPDVAVDVADLSAKVKGARSEAGELVTPRANKVGIEYIVPMSFTRTTDGYSSKIVVGLKRYEGKLLIMKAGENGFLY